MRSFQVDSLEEILVEQQEYRWTVRCPRKLADRIIWHARHNKMCLAEFLTCVISEWEEFGEEEDEDAVV